MTNEVGLIIISLACGIGLGALGFYIRDVDKQLKSLITMLFNGDDDK